MVPTINTCFFKSILLFVLVLCTFALFYTYTSTSKFAGFSNIGVNNLSVINTPIPSGTVPINILTDYDKLITPDFRSRLNTSGNNAENYYKQNNDIIVNKLNVMDDNIKAMLTGVNNSLYNQLGENYARSQQINNIHQDWLQDIDELPYKVLT